MSTSKKNRLLTYSQAILEGTQQEMTQDERVFVMGQGVDDFKGTVGTTMGLHKMFGSKRSFDVPSSRGRYARSGYRRCFVRIKAN